MSYNSDGYCEFERSSDSDSYFKESDCCDRKVVNRLRE